MDVRLPPDLQTFVDRLVEEEIVGAPQYAIEEGLRLLRAQEAFRQTEVARVRSLVQEGVDSADRGDLHDGEEVMRELIARYAEPASHRVGEAA